MSGNSRSASTRSYRSTEENTWRAFDRLPPAVRKALSEALLDWAPQRLVTMQRRGHSELSCINAIKRWDAKTIVADRKRLWGDVDPMATEMASLQGVCLGLRPEIKEVLLVERAVEARRARERAWHAKTRQARRQIRANKL